MIWRYFGWANQATASIMLWTAAAYLMRHGKFHWICTVPALFMSAVCITYLANAPIGFGLDLTTSTVIGVAGAIALAVLFFVKVRRCDAAIAAEQQA